MQIDRIRAQIEEANIIEQQTGLLRRAVTDLAKVNRVSLVELDMNKVVDFVTEYIEHAPSLMLNIEEAATMEGMLPDVQPILDATEDYFLSSDDIIPDRYGLVGLLDDAFLTHMLMEAISDKYKVQTGKSLLPIEAHETNAFIRKLIGAPFVGLLDEHVSTTLGRLSEEQDINKMLVLLAQVNLSTLPNSTWGKARVFELGFA